MRTDLDSGPGVGGLVRSPRPRPNGRRFVGLWLLSWAVPALAQVVLSSALSGLGVSGSPAGLFWLVVIAATGCVVASVAVLARALRRDEAELGYLALFYFAVSVLPLVHGLTTPGVLYDQNQATLAAAQWSIPAALLLVAPVLLPASLRHRVGHLIWRWWVAVGVVMVLAISVMMLLFTELVPVLNGGSLPAIVLGGTGFLGCTVLGRRHLYLAQVADSPLPLAVSAGYGFVGASALVWFGAEAFSIGFWVAHALDITGGFAGTVGALIAMRSSGRVRSTIGPVLATEPLAALELGLDPIVHRFVADLEQCDQVTRDHVVRTAELAVTVGTEMGLRGHELRQLGLAALLHDIGKLDIPSEILNKPGRLNEDEYRMIKRHTAFGQAIVETSPALADIGLFIRSHHERIDGNGYPDGRAGQAIPLIARIVAVCDSFDAMANTRQYRNGMGAERALSILREHAGSQWDTTVVAAVVRVVTERGDRPTGPSAPGLDTVGRRDQATEPGDELFGCDCMPTHALASTPTSSPASASASASPTR